MAQAMRDILRACAESGGVDPATGRFKEPTVKLSRCVELKRGWGSGWVAV